MAACCHTGARSRSGVWIKHSLKMVMVGEEGEQLRICVVGAGTRFLSGISVYTYRLADSLAASNRASVILMRQLLPSRLWLMWLADGFTIHAEADREAVERHYSLHGRPVEMVPVGPFDHYRKSEAIRRREAPEGTCNVLFFG